MSSMQRPIVITVREIRCLRCYVMLVTAANVSRLTAHIPLKQVLVKTGQKKRYTPVMLWAFKFPQKNNQNYF